MRVRVIVVLGMSMGCDPAGIEKRACEVPDFQATVFTLDQGTAALEGVVVLSEDVPDGRGFEIGLDDGGVYYGGVSDDLGVSETCGLTIPFSLHDLEAGAYSIEAGVQTASGGAGNLEWIGTSEPLTVADGETLTDLEITLDFARR